jgi:hypothetical protein
MYRRADVMGETGQGQLFGPGAATDPVGLFDHEDLAPRSGEMSGRSEAIGPGSHDDRVVFTHVWMSILTPGAITP